MNDSEKTTLEKYLYRWPGADFNVNRRWRTEGAGGGLVFSMPEDPAELAKDSRWPAFYPSPISIVTTGDGETALLEKVVGASIVNRFPYVVALNFCKEDLSRRHHPRRRFMDTLEKNGCAAIQFLPPGEVLDKVMAAIADVPEEQSQERIARAGLTWRRGKTNLSPVFSDAFMVYEASLVKPMKAFNGEVIYQKPFLDTGSHRLYFLEVKAIGLRGDLIKGERSILWRSLPAWNQSLSPSDGVKEQGKYLGTLAYTKSFNPHYRFPAENTVCFEADEMDGNMGIKYIPAYSGGRLDIDNEKAKWPCFFPAPLGMITSRSLSGQANVMPCGSAFMASRLPLTAAVCISHAAINDRYAPRKSLRFIREQGRFGCSVPFIDKTILQAVAYAGNVSADKDPDKFYHSGLHARNDLGETPIMDGAPVHFDCRVISETNLGTHLLILGEAERIFISGSLTPLNPLRWFPWAEITDNSLNHL